MKGGISVEKKNTEINVQTVKRLGSAAAAVGIAGGIVRGVQLCRFDEKGLPVESLFHSLIWVVLALEVLLGLGAWLWVRKKTASGIGGRPNTPEAVLPLVSAVLFAGCAAVRLAMSYKPFSFWGMVLALVSFAVAAAMPVVGRALGNSGETSEGERILSLVPVGANVLIIIEIYRSVSKNPTAGWYAFDVFAAAAVILMFFAAAGDVNRRSGIQKLIASALGAIMLAWTAALGRIIALVSGVAGGEPWGSLI
ncbi:MAG: hypothetical protein IKZ19_08245, partial [Clostridia bacterium]|nr:hypothetical protein [Clostridia bacterium]